MCHECVCAYILKITALNQLSVLCKFIFIVSIEISTLIEKLKATLVQNSMAGFGLEFAEFGTMKGKASQVKNHMVVNA